MTHINTPIAVLGAGAWGTALAMGLARNGQSVRLWDIDSELIATMQSDRMQPARLPGIPFPDKLEPVSDLADALDGIRDIFLVVPSFAFKKVLESLKPLVADDVRFAWGTKGLNPEKSHKGKGFTPALVASSSKIRTKDLFHSSHRYQLPINL